MNNKILGLPEEKLNGRIYTPRYIVENILNLSGYCGAAILNRNVVDNSCGDGAFLTVIAERYCIEFLKQSNNLDALSASLSKYIHGIEIDEGECEKCIANLNETAVLFGLKKVNWDIRCANTLYFDGFDGKMDYVVGNPPYVRVHNLGESFSTIKKFSFAGNGMTDLFIVFYELGIRMLNKNGVLGYISPSSFFASLAGKYMREYFVSNNLLDKVADLKHFKAFDAVTYTAIVILKRNRTLLNTAYYRFNEGEGTVNFVADLSPQNYYIDGNFYFSDADSLNELKKILSYKSAKEYFCVKNGFATLADNFFIGDFDFGEFVIPVLKASTGQWKKCLFPYENSRLVSYERLTENVRIKEYYETNKKMLEKRAYDGSGDWYGFGRSQGINDVNRRKYAINTLIRQVSDIKLTLCREGTGVYSGLYILTELNESELRELIECEDFISYVALLGKYKNGGYYTFSSKDLKAYLEYKYACKRGKENEQFSVFGYS